MRNRGLPIFDKLNLARCTEDTYLEVKELSQSWGIAKYEKTPGISNNVNVVLYLLKVLELKYHYDESIQ